MRNILVTGGAGFIGSHLVDRLLRAGCRVIAVDILSDFYDPRIKENNIKDHLRNPNYELYRVDIEDADNLRGVFGKNKLDCVVHIAARAGVRPSIESPDRYAKTNILGTLNVLEAMREFRVKKMIFASSSSVYGNCKADSFHEELKVTEPISPYAATKAACEQFCYTYSRLYDLQMVCLRFFTVYGPRQRPDLAISKFARLIAENKSIPLYGDGVTIRDYTFIDDIVDGIISAISYDKTMYEIINLGGGEPISLIRMVRTLEEALGKKAVLDFLPMQAGDVDRTTSNIFKARRLLGYDPKVTFKDGINRFIEWRRNEDV